MNLNNEEHAFAVINRIIRFPVIFMLLMTLAPFSVARGEEREPLRLQVADPYIELHTGAGRAYPIFHVEERGVWITILKRRTDWFKVRTERGKEGWVSRAQLEKTLTPEGEVADFADATMAEFTRHRWEMSAMGGDFEGADVLTILGGYFLTPKLGIEASASKVFAPFSDSLMVDFSVAAHPFPEWRVSPYFMVGTGVVQTDPKVTLVAERDSTDQVAHVGIGARIYLTRQFVFRMQYKHYVIFQSVDDNQEIDEWKAGFAVFF